MQTFGSSSRRRASHTVATSRAVWNAKRRVASIDRTRALDRHCVGFKLFLKDVEYRSIDFARRVGAPARGPTSFYPRRMMASFSAPSSAPRASHAVVRAQGGAPNAGAPQPGRGSRKKASRGGRGARDKARKVRGQDFAEDAGRREREFNDAIARVNAKARVGGASFDDGDRPVQSRESFEAKLAAVKAEGAKGKATASSSSSGATFNMNAKVDFGGPPAPGSPLARTLAEGTAVPKRAEDDEEESVMSSMAVRVGSFIAAVALAIVFLPTDLMFNAGVRAKSDKLSDSVKEEVLKQASAVEEALTTAPEDADKLKQAAQSYLALDDYPKALPFLERLVAVDPSEENVSALAETWIADGQPSRAVEAFRNIIDADVLGKGERVAVPSPSLLRGYLDALGKANRNGLALEYAKTFAKKGWVDEVDGQLLEARVYSSWKGHGKDAEAAYDAVVSDHPGDFRGYLAQGVFFRTVGKPDAAENAFRKAKSLAPDDTAAVVNQVIAASKAKQS